MTVTPTKLQRSNLARTAIHLLKNVKPRKFRMHDFAMHTEPGSSGRAFDRIFPRQLTERYHECGTVCCFAGHGPLALPEIRIIDGSWDQYIARVFGADRMPDNGIWLFGAWWSDSRQQAAARALMYLNGSDPHAWWDKVGGYNYNGLYLKSWTHKRLIAELEKFVIKPKSKPKRKREST